MTNQPTNQPTRLKKRRNPLAAFDALQLLALRVLAQALADAQRHGQAQLDEDADTCVTNHAQLLAWLGSPNGIMWWDLARLPWYDSAAARWRVLRDANLRVLEL